MNKKIIKSKNFLYLLFPSVAALIPAVASAARFSNFRDLVNYLVTLFNQAIALLVGLGVVYLLFGVVKTILHADNEQIRSDGRQMMLYGVIALFVIVSMWGLVNLLTNTFFGGSIPSL